MLSYAECWLAYAPLEATHLFAVYRVMHLLKLQEILGYVGVLSQMFAGLLIQDYNILLGVSCSTFVLVCTGLLRFVTLVERCCKGHCKGAQNYVIRYNKHHRFLPFVAYLLPYTVRKHCNATPASSYRRTPSPLAHTPMMAFRWLM